MPLVIFVSCALIRSVRTLVNLPFNIAARTIVSLTIALLFISRSDADAAKRVATKIPSKPNIIVIFTDDHGYADLGVQGSLTDIKTPNIDALARDGVRFTHGYVTAPQCLPSRAGMLTGRYQQRFGIDDNKTGPLPLEELTIAERLKKAGYVTGQVGKWHLDLSEKSSAEKNPINKFLPHGQGFDEYFCGGRSTYVASHDLKGKPLPGAPVVVNDSRFRVDVQTDAAVSFIERHTNKPFFLYLAWFAPHVPLEAPEKYLSRFPGDMPMERRLALAMISAMDDGVGRIRETLRAHGLDRNTLIFFVSDNGAPLKEGNWDGSLNAPFLGEKGMLTDGGVRIPFIAAWPGVLPAGKVYEPAVISLDVAATAAAVAGLPRDPILDGVNLIPFLKGEIAGEPHDALFWRWRGQAAVRTSRWKLVVLGTERRYLFDVNRPENETNNCIADHPEVAKELGSKLESWTAELEPPGLPTELSIEDVFFFATHLDKTLSVSAWRDAQKKNRNATSAKKPAQLPK